jgi:hypothetical protein
MTLRVKCFVTAGVVTLAGLCLMLSGSAGPTFNADKIFTGSSLSDWHTLGQADWKAQNGLITGTPKQPGGGWLVLNHSFEDSAFYASIKCSAGCVTGVLFRAEKTPGGGMKGVYVSLAESDPGSFAVQLDAQGREVSRQKLAAGGRGGEGAGGGGRGASGAPGGGRGASGRGAVNLYPVLALPSNINLPNLQRPSAPPYKYGDWNEVEIFLYGTTVRPTFNGGGGLGGGAGNAGGNSGPENGRYGPIALYIGGTAQVELKDLRYKDLEAIDLPKEVVSSNFRIQRLSEYYYSWTASIADVNKDGTPDVIAGPYYYLGPDYNVGHEIYTPKIWNPTVDYPQTSMVGLAYDFTGDGWPDILVMSGNAGNGTGTLYVNPAGENRHWDHYVVLEPVGNEETLLKDIDGDGKPEIIHAGHNTLQYSKPDPKNPTGTWITRTISEPGPWGANIGHGLGVGDINGDGRMDFVNAYGWWEQPPKDSKQELWTYHAQDFGRWGRSQGGAGGAEIGIYDVNGDGLPDVVTALEGHGFGLAWYEQKRDAKGTISFVEHTIMDGYLDKNAGDVMFTEPHSVAFADMNGDGILDMITGKRAMSHLGSYSDPDPWGPEVTYVYYAVRDKSAPGGAKFVPELVHNRSGVGSHIAVGDLNGDGKPDIVTSGVHGTFIFFNQYKGPAGR